jgi:hypothetical protein
MSADSKTASNLTCSIQSAADCGGGQGAPNKLFAGATDGPATGVTSWATTREVPDLLRLLLLFLLYVQTAMCESQSGVEYLGEGTIQYTYFGPSAAVVGETERRFRFGVTDDMWAAQTVLSHLWFQGEALSTDTELTLSAWTDGDRVYEMRRFNTNLLAGRNEASATIHPGRVPVGLDQTLHDLWIGLGSAAYFQGLGDTKEGFIFPLVALPYQKSYAGDFRVLAAWRLNPVVPHVPKDVAFTDWRADQISTPPESDRWTITNSHLLVDTWTNVSGLVLPRSFTVHHFVRSGEAPLLRARSHVTVTNYQPQVSPALFNKTVSGQTLVRDNRFLQLDGGIHPEHFTYWVSNRWLSDKEVRNAYNVFAAAQAAPPSKRVPFWLVVVIGALAAAPLVLMIRRTHTHSPLRPPSNK